MIRLDKYSGKTTLLRSIYTDIPYVSLEDIDIRNAASTDPRGFLNNFPGGAVLDESGKVIGVVMAKTNADPDQNSKEIFQQVNFAISADVARQYLSSQGVEYKSASSLLKRDLTEIADEAKLFTAVVSCEAK